MLQANDLVKSKYRDRRAASPTDYIQTNNSKKDRDYASYKNQQPSSKGDHSRVQSSKRTRKEPQPQPAATESGVHLSSNQLKTLQQEASRHALTATLESQRQGSLNLNHHHETIAKDYAPLSSKHQSRKALTAQMGANSERAGNRTATSVK